MGRKKKYLTEEERRAAQRENEKRYREKHKKERLEYYYRNKESISEKNKQYYQENKEEILEKHREWKNNNPTYNEEYYKKNKDKLLEQSKQYYNTPMGRANHLLSGYKTNDEKYNRGECTITLEWMIENIFTQPCHYCGEEGWEIMGCDRIDNSKPHTPDNVVPCCRECNLKKQKKDYEEFIKEMGMT